MSRCERCNGEMHPMDAEQFKRCHRCRRKMRTRAFTGGVCPYGHAMVGDNVLVVKNGNSKQYKCRECWNARQKVYYAEHKEELKKKAAIRHDKKDK